MKKKTGFTLIELLAVIVILAIIALIAVPVIMNIISKARKSAFEDTAYGLMSAGEMYYAEMLLEPNGMTENKIFILSDGTITPSVLNVKGSIPNGSVGVSMDGKVAIAINNGINCITKGYNDNNITTSDYTEGACTLPALPAKPGTLAYVATTNEFAESVNSCATSGICEVGTKFAIKVNDTETKNFYVIKDENNTVTLLMDSTLGNDVMWYTEEDNTKGPLTALDALDDRTKEWTNLPKGYTTIDENTPAVYSSITRSNARARLIKNEEADAIVNRSNPWAYGTEYWTSFVIAATPSHAIYVQSGGALGGEYVNVEYGLRPVIEIPKSII